MQKRTVALLALQMDEAYGSLLGSIEGLTDEEFLWEPVPGCWTVRLDTRDRWTLDYAIPAPAPPPFTTIAWRLIHLATCKVMYYEHAFGPAELTWDSLEIPHTFTDSTAMLKTGQQLLRNALDGLADADLEEERRTNWGDMWPTWRIFWVMISHDLGHGAEIGCLRDLYRTMDRKTSAAKPGEG
jgi:hypothetical protein